MQNRPLFMIGLSFLMLGFGCWVEQNYFMQSMPRAQALVLDVVSTNAGTTRGCFTEGSTNFSAKLQIETRNGKLLRDLRDFQNSCGKDLPLWRSFLQVGNHVEVVYDPENDKRTYRTDRGTSHSIVSVICLYMATCCILWSVRK